MNSFGLAFGGAPQALRLYINKYLRAADQTAIQVSKLKNMNIFFCIAPILKRKNRPLQRVKGI
jgi:hypothetical protein